MGLSDSYRKFRRQSSIKTQNDDGNYPFRPFFCHMKAESIDELLNNFNLRKQKMSLIWLKLKSRLKWKLNLELLLQTFCLRMLTRLSLVCLREQQDSLLCNQVKRVWKLEEKKLGWLISYDFGKIKSQAVKRLFREVTRVIWSDKKLVHNTFGHSVIFLSVALQSIKIAQSWLRRASIYQMVSTATIFIGIGKLW